VRRTSRCAAGQATAGSTAPATVPGAGTRSLLAALAIAPAGRRIAWPLGTRSPASRRPHCLQLKLRRQEFAGYRLVAWTPTQCLYRGRVLDTEVWMILVDPAIRDLALVDVVERKRYHVAVFEVL